MTEKQTLTKPAFNYTELQEWRWNWGAGGCTYQQQSGSCTVQGRQDVHVIRILRKANLKRHRRLPKFSHSLDEKLTPTGPLGERQIGLGDHSTETLFRPLPSHHPLVMSNATHLSMETLQSPELECCCYHLKDRRLKHLEPHHHRHTTIQRRPQDFQLPALLPLS